MKAGKVKNNDASPLHQQAPFFNRSADTSQGSARNGNFFFNPAASPEPELENDGAIQMKSEGNAAAGPPDIKQNTGSNPVIQRQSNRGIRVQMNMPRLIREFRVNIAGRPDIAALVQNHPIGGSQRFTEGSRHGSQSPDIQISNVTQSGSVHRWFLRTRWFDLPSRIAGLTSAISGSGPLGAGEFDPGTERNIQGALEHHTVINIDLDRPDLAAALRAPSANPAQVLEDASRNTLLHELMHLSLYMQRTMGTTPATGTVVADFQTRLLRAQSPALASQRTRVYQAMEQLVNLAETTLRSVLEQNRQSGNNAPISVSQYQLFPDSEFASRQAFMDRRFNILIEEHFVSQAAGRQIPPVRTNADLAAAYGNVASNRIDRQAALKSYGLASLYAPPSQPGAQPQQGSFLGIHPATRPPFDHAWRIGTSNLVQALEQLYNAL